MSKQIVDRGAFGWLYHTLLKAAGSDEPMFRQNTELIMEKRKNLSSQELDNISGLLQGMVEEKEALLDEIYSWDECMIKEKAHGLLCGGLLSKTDDVYCLMSGRCPYPVENNCILCRYSIKTTFSLVMVGEELEKLLLELGSYGMEYTVDRLRLTYQIGRLVMILKEAIEEFGHEYINTFVEYEKINSLIQMQWTKMVFLEGTHNDTE